MSKSYSHFFSKKFQHICASFDVNFNESLTNDVVSFEQLGPDLHIVNAHISFGENLLISYSRFYPETKILTDVQQTDDQANGQPTCNHNTPPLLCGGYK